MKHIIQALLYCICRVAFWFRYRIHVKGWDNVTPQTMKKKGGVLFLPNHPTYYIDPLLMAMLTYPRYTIRPTIVEYMYYKPIIHSVMKVMGALPIPNFSTTSNSLKKRKGEKVIQEIISSLQNGENFLLYPAGRVKHSAKEVVAGASSTQKIISEATDANIVLVRITGLWGSSFSRALTGQPADLGAILLQGLKDLFKNFIFFGPRRDVYVEFVPAPADFPYQGTRLEINRYLEKFYNRPDGLSLQTGDEPGESLVLRPSHLWNNQLPVPSKLNSVCESVNVSLSDIDPAIRNKVVEKVSQITDIPADQISLEMDVSKDLGLDSLDTAELSSFLHEEFSIKGVPVHQITTVGTLVGIAAKKIPVIEEEEPINANKSKWARHHKRETIEPPSGNTLIEMFLNTADHLGNISATADARSGVLTYSQIKMRVVLLAEEFKKLPGKYIGVMLPASAGSVIVVLALQLAGKIPLMVNWTVGPRHLEQVIRLSNVKVVLSSWAFLDRLGNVDLDGIEGILVMLEDLARDISIFKKLKAVFRSKRKADSIIRLFGADRITPETPAVLLFTSGTESLPKGVPLSHHNIISNMNAVVNHVSLYNDDVILCTLPPFHSFGFTIAGLYGPIVGIRAAYSPDPTNGKQLAEAFGYWGVTMMVGAPTFIRGMLRVAQPEQMTTMRMCVTGAEKAPAELFAQIEALGKGDILLEGYGITECSPVLTANKLGLPHRGVGIPLKGVWIEIVHPETGEKLKTGEQGMILARGENVFSGYLNPDVKSPFVEYEGKTWYKTGDLGYLDEEGWLFITGRLKRFIKIGGEMLSLGSIEESLTRYFLAFQQSEEEGDRAPVAICAKEIPGDKPKISLFTKHKDVSLDEINKFLREDGFSNMVRISGVKTVEEIPLMGTGKVNYRKLESMLEEQEG